MGRALYSISAQYEAAFQGIDRRNGHLWFLVVVCRVRCSRLVEFEFPAADGPTEASGLSISAQLGGA